MSEKKEMLKDIGDAMALALFHTIDYIEKEQESKLVSNITDSIEIEVGQDLKQVISGEITALLYVCVLVGLNNQIRNRDDFKAISSVFREKVVNTFATMYSKEQKEFKKHIKWFNKWIGKRVKEYGHVIYDFDDDNTLKKTIQLFLSHVQNECGTDLKGPTLMKAIEELRFLLHKFPDEISGIIGSKLE